MHTDVTLSKGWKFHLGEVAYGYYKGFDDSGWQNVTLPHDWSVEHPFDKAYSSGTGYLAGGVGWYRLRFSLPDTIKDQAVRITFGGVYKNSRIWCNTHYLGMRPYGYTTFSYDLTGLTVPGENVIAVRCEHIDLADSRWFTGNGIYRDVMLSILPRIHFLRDTVFVSTVSADAQEAVLKVSWQLSEAAQTDFELKDGLGRTCAMAQAETDSREALLKVAKPLLWSPDSPDLYTLICRAGDDTFEVRTGIRTFAFDAEKGFFLNGINMKIKGVCVHHDAGALGAAVPKAVWARRLRKLKAAGCNALRASHNPPDSALLDLCDEMGLLVMDEAFDEWEGCKNKWWQGHNVYPPKHYGYSDAFPDWHEQDLKAMVLRDRNHPSIILWSIGNEIDYPNDPYVHPLFESATGNNDANKPEAERLYDPNKPDARRLTVISQKLVNIVKRHDATRPVTSALALPELSNLIGYAQTLDAVGYNYKEHLYREDREKYPRHVIYGSENGHGVKEWLAVRDHEDICGQFLWTGVDFLGEAKGWPVRVSGAGLLTTAGFEKPRFYHRMAMWTEELMVSLATSDQENDWFERFSWDYAPGQTVYVSVYTNGQNAELFLNGRSLGIKPAADKYQAVFAVPFEKGELQAVARRGEKEAFDMLYTPGELDMIQLTPDKPALYADGMDIAQVEVALLDDSGRLIASRDEVLSYALVGDGELLGIENGAMDDLTPYPSKKRATHGGRAIAYIRAGETAGELTLYVTAKGGVRTACTLSQK